MATFHKSTFGAHAAEFRADRAGYVHTSVLEVRLGQWGPRPTQDEAREIAAHNKEVVARAKLRLAPSRV